MSKAEAAPHRAREVLWRQQAKDREEAERLLLEAAGIAFPSYNPMPAQRKAWG